MNHWSKAEDAMNAALEWPETSVETPEDVEAALAGVWNPGKMRIEVEWNKKVRVYGKTGIVATIDDHFRHTTTHTTAGEPIDTARAYRVAVQQALLYHL